MLKFENNRIYCGGVSLPVPNGLYLETNSDLVYDDGIFLYSEHKDFYIVLKFEEYIGTAENHLKLELEEMEYVTCSDINKFVLNGLQGVNVIYTYTHNEHYEACFDPAFDGSNIHLSISVGVPDKKKFRVMDVFKQKKIINFISNIRKDQ